MHKELLKLNNKKTTQAKIGKRSETDPLAKILRWQMDTWKAWHHLSPGKCKLKMRCQRTAIGTAETPDTATCWWGRGTAGALCRWDGSVGRPLDSSLTSFRTRHVVVQQPHTWVFIRVGWELCPHRNLHPDVYNNFIHNCWNLEAPKVSFSKWWINELRYIQREY